MKTVLIVVDYQNDFVDGALGFPGAEKLEGAICQKIEAAAQAGGDVIFTFDTHRDDYLETKEGRDLPIPHCLEGTPGWELYGRVKDCHTPQTKAFCKETFGSLALAEYLSGMPYEQVELVGLVSNICVLSNAVLARAALPQARIRIDAACTLGPDPALHQKALDVMQGLGIEVYNR